MQKARSTNQGQYPRTHSHTRSFVEEGHRAAGGARTSLKLWEGPGGGGGHDRATVGRAMVRHTQQAGHTSRSERQQQLLLLLLLAVDAASVTHAAAGAAPHPPVMNATDLRMPTLINFNLRRPISDAEGIANCSAYCAQHSASCGGWVYVSPAFLPRSRYTGPRCSIKKSGACYTAPGRPGLFAGALAGPCTLPPPPGPPGPAPPPGPPPPHHRGRVEPYYTHGHGQALHHSTGLSPPAPAAAAQRSRGRRLAHSLSDSLIVKGVRGRGWSGGAGGGRGGGGGGGGEGVAWTAVGSRVSHLGQCPMQLPRAPR
eukprot:COSAG06_NODE_11169_length_1552_cov_2.454921_2_plen_312_part_01